MPVRAQALTMHYFATDADGPKTGDVGNHSLRIIEDGAIGTIAASPAEVDATNAPGIYKVAITGAENTADVVTLCGKSSTSGVTISPSTWTNITNADANVAAILTDTGTTLNDKIDVIDGIVDSILVDTDTTLDTVVDSILAYAVGIDGKVTTIDGIVDDILVDTAALSTPISANVTQISGSATAADNMELGSLAVTAGTSHNSPAPTVDAFASDTGALSSTNDFYNGRIIIFTSGSLAGQARTILDYTGATKLFTCDPFTTAPPNDSTFLIV